MDRLRVSSIGTYGNRLLAVLGGLVLAVASSAEPSLPDVAEVVKPPSGSGPILVLLTGADGAFNHRHQAQAYAGEGWLVQVVDSNRLMGADPAQKLRQLLTSTAASPEAVGRRSVLVGYSLGGWIVLAYGSRMPDLVASAVVYYPSTFRMGDAKAFLANPPLSVPTIMFAGVKDTYMNCCTIERARALAEAAALPDVRASLRVVEYPEADHGFVLPAYPPVYRPADERDAFLRAVAHLRAARGTP